MARITVEDCLRKIPNRYALVHAASKRARQLLKGAQPLIRSKNRPIVISLREIALSKIILLTDTYNENANTEIDDVASLSN